MHGSTAGWTPRGRLASRSKSDDVFLSMPISASVGLVGFTFGTPLLPTPREPARSGVWSSNFPSPASASILTACAYPITSSPSRWRAAKMACASAGRRRWWHGQPARGSGRPGSLLTLAPHRSGRAGSAASGSSTDSFATRRRVPAGPGSQAMATAIPKACLASSAIRCRDVETGPNLGVLAVFPSNGATCRCPLPSTGSRGLNSPASAVL